MSEPGKMSLVTNDNRKGHSMTYASDALLTRLRNIREGEIEPHLGCPIFMELHLLALGGMLNEKGLMYVSGLCSIEEQYLEKCLLAKTDSAITRE